MPLDEQARILDHLRAAEPWPSGWAIPSGFGWIACYLCFHFSVMGEHDRAIAAGQRALALATTSGAFDVQVIAQNYLGVAYYAVGDYRQALDVSQRVIALLTGELLYERFGLPVLPAVLSRGYVAWCLAELGASLRGLAEEKKRYGWPRRWRSPPVLIVVLYCVGLVLPPPRGAPEGHPHARTGPGALPERRHTAALPPDCLPLGAAYALAGRAAEALPLLDQVLERVATGSRLLLHALVLTELSEACLLVGRVDEASALAERLLELSRTHTGHGYQAHAYRLLGEVARHRDPPEVDQATAHYRQALALAEELGMRPLQAHCHLGLGTLYARTGQRQQAHAELSTAIDLYRVLDMTSCPPRGGAGAHTQGGERGEEGASAGGPPRPGSGDG